MESVPDFYSMPGIRKLKHNVLSLTFYKTCLRPYVVRTPFPTRRVLGIFLQDPKKEQIAPSATSLPDVRVVARPFFAYFQHTHNITMHSDISTFESLRSKKPQLFIDSIGFDYCDEWKALLKGYGIKVTEELKLIEDSEFTAFFEQR